MNSKVLVVGGKGYIGSHLRHKKPQYIYTNSSDFDMNDLEQTENFLKEFDIEMCIILSAKISYEKDIDMLDEPFKTNVGGLNNLLQTLKRKNKDIKIVYFSSMSVYDENSISPVVESTNPLPLHSYGLSKVYAEELIKFYRLKSLIIRIPGIYGGDRKSGFIYNTIKKLQNGEDIEIDTKDLGYWESIHIDDMLNIFIDFISKYKFHDICEIFNLSYGEKTDFIATANFLKESMDSKSVVKIDKKYKDLYLSNKKISKYTDINLNYYDSLKKYLDTILKEG